MHIKVNRYVHNPIIRPADLKSVHEGYEVICVFNAGVAKLGDDVLLLLRVAERPIADGSSVCKVPVVDLQTGGLKILNFPVDDPEYDFSDPRVVRTPHGNYLTSISYLRVARSKDGVHFDVENQAALYPDNEYEIYGIEDPRITRIDDTFYITYSAISDRGITAALASTTDFKAFRKHGIAFAPPNKDVVLFPEKINGKYYALHRPSPDFLGEKDVWIAESSDLFQWGNHRHLFGRRKDLWDNKHVGASAVPFLTDKGWLEIYHASDQEGCYSLGAILLDRNEPGNILARAEVPVLKPEEPYEVNGFYGHTVFTCGVLVEDGLVKIYYGACDTTMAYAEIELQDILNVL